MSYAKKNYLYALNSIIPLFCGLFLYMTISDDTLISHSLSSLRSLMPIIDYPHIIRNYAADFVWAYSLFFCLKLTLGDELSGKHNIIALLLTVVAAAVIECLQLKDIFYGTFDMLDIVVESAAAVCALYISNMIERRHDRYEEKQCC